MKTILVILAVVVVVLLVNATYSTSADPAPQYDRPTSQPLDPEAARAIEEKRAESEKKRAEQELEAIRAATVEAAALWTAYDANEVQADRSYKNQHLYVRGVVREIGKDFLDTPFIVLVGPNEFSGVQFAFSKGDESELANIRKGQTLTIGGKCSGRIMMDVFVKDSKIAAQ